MENFNAVRMHEKATKGAEKHKAHVESLKHNDIQQFIKLCVSEVERATNSGKFECTIEHVSNYMESLQPAVNEWLRERGFHSLWTDSSNSKSQCKITWYVPFYK